MDAVKMEVEKVFMVACKTNDLDWLKDVTQQLDISVQDDVGMTGLMWADDTQVMEYLIAKGCDVNTVNNDGNTALHLTCLDATHNAPSVVLDHGADIDVQNKNGHTPLHYCIYNRQADHCALLIEKGARPNIQDKDGLTPLFMACDRGRVDSCRLLLKYGAKADIKTNTGYLPIHQAIFKGHDECCKLLLNQGAAVDAEDPNGHTTLQIASEYNRIACCRVLIKGGASVDKQDKDGWAPLHFASSNGRYECCRLLLKRGALVNIRSNEGETPLHCSIKDGFLECCKLLLEYGANVDATNDFGANGLYLASLQGYTECCRLLIKHGASVNIPVKYGWTPVAVASYYGHVECLRLLLENGAFMNCRGGRRQTPLFYACQNGHIGGVGLLLKKGADTTLSGSGRRTPMNIAKSKGQKEILQMLKTFENVSVSVPSEEPKVDQDKCEYTQLCCEFKQMLALQDCFFNNASDVCFCENCHSERGDSMHKTTDETFQEDSAHDTSSKNSEECNNQDETSEEKSLPIGWRSFGLAISVSFECLSGFKEGQTAFCGTQVECVKRILEKEGVLLAGDYTSERRRTQPPHSPFNGDKPSMSPHPEHGPSTIFLSPPMGFSGLEKFAPKYTFIDPTTQIICKARVAFQVRMKPGLHESGHQTTEAANQLDLEGTTESKEIAILEGLLVKVEKLVARLQSISVEIDPNPVM